MKTTVVDLERAVEVAGALTAEQTDILSPGALEFLLRLHKHFNSRRIELLAAREQVQQRIDAGWTPTFSEYTRQVRESGWTVAPLPLDLLDRRVEITGPVDRKMIINALNSEARVFMADVEDSHAPSWTNTIQGQVNLRDAVNGTIDYTHPKTGKYYKLKSNPATLMVRPRGLHMVEKHLLVAGEPMSASLVDFGLYFYHNAQNLLEQGSGPYFYLPKLEHFQEARWWNEVFVFAQDYLGIQQGTIKATVLIETILASFQLDEILYELREHSAGLNCGRWDYIFSFIKRFRNRPGFVLPDRDQVTMTVPFMRAYSRLVIQTCHKRNVHAMGGMAAQIPVRGNDAVNKEAFEKVRADKLREAKDGHDGTWVAHPGLVPVAMEVFNRYMPCANQIHRTTVEEQIEAADLLEIPEGTITPAGVRKNINVGIQYIAAWLSGNGAAAIHHMMEDAATAEISRTQVWQWLQREVTLSDGNVFNLAYFADVFTDEADQLRHSDTMNPAWRDQLEPAIALFRNLVTRDELDEFLTLEAYDLLNPKK